MSILSRLRESWSGLRYCRNRQKMLSLLCKMDRESPISPNEELAGEQLWRRIQSASGEKQ